MFALQLSLRARIKSSSLASFEYPKLKLFLQVVGTSLQVSAAVTSLDSLLALSDGALNGDLGRAVRCLRVALETVQNESTQAAPAPVLEHDAYAANLHWSFPALDLSQGHLLSRNTPLSPQRHFPISPLQTMQRPPPPSRSTLSLLQSPAHRDRSPQQLSQQNALVSPIRCLSPTGVHALFATPNQPPAFPVLRPHQQTTQQSRTATTNTCAASATAGSATANDGASQRSSTQSASNDASLSRVSTCSLPSDVSSSATNPSPMPRSVGAAAPERENYPLHNSQVQFVALNQQQQQQVVSGVSATPSDSRSSSTSLTASQQSLSYAYFSVPPTPSPFIGGRAAAPSIALSGTSHHYVSASSVVMLPVGVDAVPTRQSAGSSMDLVLGCGRGTGRGATPPASPSRSAGTVAALRDSYSNQNLRSRVSPAPGTMYVPASASASVRDPPFWSPIARPSPSSASSSEKTPTESSYAYASRNMNVAEPELMLARNRQIAAKCPGTPPHRAVRSRNTLEVLQVGFPLTKSKSHESELCVRSGTPSSAPDPDPDSISLCSVGACVSPVPGPGPRYVGVGAPHIAAAVAPALSNATDRTAALALAVSGVRSGPLFANANGVVPGTSPGSSACAGVLMGMASGGGGSAIAISKAKRKPHNLKLSAAAAGSHEALFVLSAATAAIARSPLEQHCNSCASCTTPSRPPSAPLQCALDDPSMYAPPLSAVNVNSVNMNDSGVVISASASSCCSPRFFFSTSSVCAHRFASNAHRLVVVLHCSLCCIVRKS